MTLISPVLDDRSFTQLLAQAQDRLRQACPGWSDASPSDPGHVLLELFAYLTEQLVYRVNRVPEKAYVEFLRLIGVRLIPPAAAQVQLVFTRTRLGSEPIEIPRGTRVTSERAEAGREAPVFATLRAAVIPAGKDRVDVEAAHCLLVEGEAAAVADGEPGAMVSARKSPLILPTGDELDLAVGVETAAGEDLGGAAVIQHQGKVYRLWREVDTFADLRGDEAVFIADRNDGTVQFAPAVHGRERGRLAERTHALALVPPAGREIRLWYRHGGGPEGNLAAGRLTVMKDPIPGVTVSNPEAASGGAAGETVENALVRGPSEFYALKRAVTAFDYELIAVDSGAAARALAFTRASVYAHAQPGAVEVVLVPCPGDDERANENLDLAGLRGLQSEEARAEVAHALDDCRPLGSSCVVSWASCKSVRIKARVVVQNHVDAAGLKAEVVASLHRRINPLPLAPYEGWNFGEALRVSHLYDLILAKPGVSYVDQVSLMVDDVPDARVAAVASDPFRPRSWFAAAGEQVFMSEDDGDGWQLAVRFPAERIAHLRCHPRLPGVLAAACLDDQGSHVWWSGDGGQGWSALARTAFKVQDMAWMVREGVPLLLLATDAGLYELAAQPGAVPLQILVVSEQQDLGFFAVAVSTDRGETAVAVAAESLGGVFLSIQAGKAGTFQELGPKGMDVRVLGVLQDGPRSFLWAGLAAVGNENGKGCLCRELRVGQDAAADSWRWATKGWSGGSVHSLAFRGTTVIAASHRAGVLSFDTAAQDAAWQAPAVECGLPLRDQERLFQPVEAVAADAQGQVTLAAGIQGVYRAGRDLGRFECCSRREFADKVTIPDSWLLSSGAHDIEVVAYADLKERLG